MRRRRKKKKKKKKKKNTKPSSPRGCTNRIGELPHKISSLHTNLLQKLSGVLRLIHESAEPQLGFIYKTMDQAKENIRNEFDKEEMPFWKAIDEWWENCLHSPLHSAAYFLHPRFRYSIDSYADTEVCTDLSSCISNMVKEMKVLRLGFEQVGLYAKGMGPFSRVDAIQQSSSISAAQRWSRYGKECPELGSLAIRILSQTCDGASKYHLDRGWAEKILTEEGDEMEQ